MSSVIDNYIKDFNENLGEYFWPLAGQNLDPGSESKGCLNVYVPRKKYSDWDMHGYSKPEYQNNETIKKVLDFILSYPGFLKPSIIICKASSLSGAWQHIDNMNAVQVMSFLKNEGSAPFFDTTLFFNKQLIKSFFSDYQEDSSIDWLFITAWRKLKNLDQEKYQGIYNNYIAPFLGQDANAAINKPDNFFIKRLASEGYEPIIEFLTK